MVVYYEDDFGINDNKSMRQLEFIEESAFVPVVNVHDRDIVDLTVEKPMVD